MTFPLPVSARRGSKRQSVFPESLLMIAADMRRNDLSQFELVLTAPAKINLALHVVGQRTDGYHLLESIVTFADRGDRIGFSASTADRFTVSGAFCADIPSDGAAAGGNLVLTARDSLRALLQRYGHAAGPVHLHLEKNLPVASGIGGGSADAAATLKGLLALWQAPEGLADTSNAGELAEIAIRLGADVPMCFQGRPLVARGIGEHTEILRDFPRFPMLLVNPLVPVSTPAIFRLLTNKTNPPLVLPGKQASAGEWFSALAAMRNDLEPPARLLEPVIAEVSQALAADALFTRMSGSGATCFGLYETEQARDAAAEALSANHPDWYVLRCFSVAGDDDGKV